MNNYTLFSGETVEYPPPAPAVAAFLARVQAAANDPSVSPAELLALVYSIENPLLDTTVSPGCGMVTKAVFAEPVYQIMSDVLFRRQLAASGQTADQIATPYTISVQDAAKQLGITESSVRAAITARKLSAHMRNGQWYLRPESIASYKVSNRGRKKSPAGVSTPEPSAVHVRCGSAPGGSLSVRIERGDLFVESKEGNAVIGKFPADWTHALVRTTTTEGVRVFEIEPEVGAAGCVDHVGLFVHGPFKVTKKHNSTKAAVEAWKQFDGATAT